MLLLRKILWPVSLLYGAGVYLRNLLYDLNLKSSLKFQTPTISVGNLSLGGTGKTPMIEWLIRNLGERQKLAVLSRGYRRSSTGFVIAEDSSTAEDIGDEPLQLFRKFPGLIMACDANRRRGLSVLEEGYDPDIILLDDAFQHRKVTPTFSILLTTYNKPYSRDWFLPTGTLRDSRSQSVRADLIVVTKCPSELGEDRMQALKRELNPTQGQQVLFSSLEYATALKGRSGNIFLDSLKNVQFTLVTGIADPEPLVKHLRSLGLNFEHKAYGDHHQFTETELNVLRNEKWIVTTEKDYVRGLQDLKQAHYLEVRHRFLGDGKRKLIDAIGQLEG